MPTSDNRRAVKEDTYADCLHYLSVDAEYHGLQRVAFTLREARKKVSALARERIANDNLHFDHEETL